MGESGSFVVVWVVAVVLLVDDGRLLCMGLFFVVCFSRAAILSSVGIPLDWD